MEEDTIYCLNRKEIEREMFGEQLIISSNQKYKGKKCEKRASAWTYHQEQTFLLNFQEDPISSIDSISIQKQPQIKLPPAKLSVAGQALAFINLKQQKIAELHVQAEQMDIDQNEYEESKQQNQTVIDLKLRGHHKHIQYFQSFKDLNSNLLAQAKLTYPCIRQILNKIDEPYDKLAFKNYEEQAKVFSSLVNSQIQSVLARQKAYYIKVQNINRRIYEHNKFLIRYSFKEGAFCPQKLIIFDVLSIYFQQNYTYHQYCENNQELYGESQLEALTGIQKGFIRKYSKFYFAQIKYIRKHVYPKLQDIIILQSLLKMKIRIYHYQKNYYIENPSILLQSKQASVTSASSPGESNQQQSPLFSYNFSEFFYLVGLKQTNRSLRNQLQLEHFKSIVQMESQQEQRYSLIVAKIKLRISFSSMFIIIKKMRRNIQIQKNPTKRRRPILEYQSFRQNTWCLFMKYLKRKQNDEKVYNIDTQDEQIRDQIILAAIQRLQKLRYLTIHQLQLENQTRQLLTFKKFQIRYHAFKRHRNDEFGQKEGNNDNDQALTLILGSTNDKFLFFLVSKERVIFERYLTLLRRSMPKINIKQPFVTVIVQNQIDKLGKWRQYCRFFNHMKAVYKSNTYISLSSIPNVINNVLYSFVHCRLARKIDTIAPAKFCEVAEADIQAFLAQMLSNWEMYQT